MMHGYVLAEIIGVFGTDGGGVLAGTHRARTSPICWSASAVTANESCSRFSG